MRKTTDFSRVDKLVNKMLQDGLTLLGGDIKKRAIILAPKDTGALRSSAKVELKNSSAVISFNTAYSRIRHEVNKLHPSTKKYLANSVKSISDVKKYFKGF